MAVEIAIEIDDRFNIIYFIAQRSGARMMDRVLSPPYNWTYDVFPRLAANGAL
jgi:hypothetical protein